MAGALASIAHNWWRNKQEYRSLILSFAAELVSLFERCAMYFEQAHQGSVSYSALFSFTDSSAFSKFASVSKDAEVPTAIIELKATYFQVQRHVEEASRYSLEGSRASDATKKQEWMTKATHAQRTALAFFLSGYEDTERLTALLLNTAQRVSPGQVGWKLSNRFTQAKNKIDYCLSSN